MGDNILHKYRAPERELRKRYSELELLLKALEHPIDFSGDASMVFALFPYIPKSCGDPFVSLTFLLSLFVTCG